MPWVWLRYATRLNSIVRRLLSNGNRVASSEAKLAAWGRVRRCRSARQLTLEALRQQPAVSGDRVGLRRAFQAPVGVASSEAMLAAWGRVRRCRSARQLASAASRQQLAVSGDGVGLRRTFQASIVGSRDTCRGPFIGASWRLTIRSSRTCFVTAKAWQKKLATLLPPLRKSA